MPGVACGGAGISLASAAHATNGCLRELPMGPRKPRHFPLTSSRSASGDFILANGVNEWSSSSIQVFPGPANVVRLRSWPRLLILQTPGMLHALMRSRNCDEVCCVGGTRMADVVDADCVLKAVLKRHPHGRAAGRAVCTAELTGCTTFPTHIHITSLPTVRFAT